jgi:hypothetical protein
MFPFDWLFFVWAWMLGPANDVTWQEFSKLLV